MCSLWKSMEESDDGNLEAVVRGYSRMNPYNWQPAPFGIDPGSTFNATISNSMVFSNLMLASAPASPAAMDLQDLCGPYYSSNISNGGALRSASSCSSLLFESMEVQAAGVASCPIFGADSPTALRKPGDHRETKEESNNSVEMSPRVPESLDVVGSKPLKVEPVKESDGSSSSLSQAAENGASSQPTSKGQGSKRRKTQQKRIVCVPAAGGTNRPSGEGLPSDLWAWRKYGQKPIKGSPYPRGYYRCSSSKGCSARKQVERSRTDPTMLVITYTSDHNHPWPTHRNALAGSTRQTASEKNTQVKKEENSEAIMMPENNNDTTVPAPSNSSPEGGPAEPENMSTIIQEDYNHHPPPAAELGNLFRPDDDFFAELGELPEPLNIFPRHFDDDKSDEDESASSVVDPFNLFNWSSPPTTFVDTKTAM